MTEFSSIPLPFAAFAGFIKKGNAILKRGEKLLTPGFRVKNSAVLIPSSATFLVNFYLKLVALQSFSSLNLKISGKEVSWQGLVMFVIKVPVSYSQENQKHGRRVRGQIKTIYYMQINDR